MSDWQLFHGPNAGYMWDLYERYCADPHSVDEATRAYFAAWQQANGEAAPAAAAAPASAAAPPGAAAPAPRPAPQASNGSATAPAAPSTPPPARHVPRAAPAASPTPPDSDSSGSDDNGSFSPAEAMEYPGAPHDLPPGSPEIQAVSTETGIPFDIPQIVSAARLVRFIREHGHMAAHIDPLGSEPPGDPGLDLEYQGLTPDLLAAMPPIVVRSSVAQGAANALEAIQRLRQIYSGSIGYDEDHVQVHAERKWLRDVAETGYFFVGMTSEYKRAVLERLTEVESFERFLHQTFLGQKRFSIEGNDMLVPMLDSIIHEASVAGTHEVVLGMAHRGRLNVLAHVLGKPYSAILAEFQGPNLYNRGTYLGWTGDVKYHLGARLAYREGGVYEMPVTLVPNPSHLEFVNPVTEGRARAAQERRDRRGAPEHDLRGSLPILIHGDASFPGQGVVAETLNMSRLHGYHTGGTIHIITNNQIGFTTESGDARSTLYAGDLAKGFEIPVIHVNADDPAACIAAARMAWAYREKFAKDFLIDMIGYRRWGHNESDEPAYTQPRMYHIINNHPTVREIWAHRLEDEGVIDSGEAESMMESAMSRLQQALEEVEKRGRIDATMAVSVSSLLHRPYADPTPINAETLTQMNDALLKLEDDFQMHAKLNRSMQRRRDALGKERGIDWAHGETLAFASILAEGTPIRLSGQDTERGTFSQRHLVLHDHETGERYVPLQNLPQAQASFSVYNSPLSESSTLGFEYGFSMHAPDTLVLWEAQFGDFANGAQVIIDQFIVSGYAKWGQRPSLVMLLPHGYEGQGPDHSNARPERFLQLAADNNIRVVNCTTAAQYYHLLRRQAALLRSDPRPLIVMTPKSLLRHPMSASSLHDLVHGRFHCVLPPAREHDPAQIERLILCSGKVYVDLMSSNQQEGRLVLPEWLAVARVEELYPFPVSDLEELLSGYPALRELVWLQEEPANMGAWTYIRSLLHELLDRLEISARLRYMGRAESASTAEGSHEQHEYEQRRLLREVVQRTE
jgi:2-oxoglutarate dehydrogenase E1 component